MLYTSPWSRFELTTSVVIGTYCIGSCKSNYHTIMATTAPLIFGRWLVMICSQPYYLVGQCPLDTVTFCQEIKVIMISFSGWIIVSYRQWYSVNKLLTKWQLHYQTVQLKICVDGLSLPHCLVCFIFLNHAYIESSTQ
jgi:hypothetical protein